MRFFFLSTYVCVWLLALPAVVCAQGEAEVVEAESSVSDTGEQVVETNNSLGFDDDEGAFDHLALPMLPEFDDALVFSGKWEMSVRGLFWQMRSGVKGHSYIENSSGETVLASDDTHSNFQPGIQLSVVKNSFLKEGLSLVAEGIYIDWQDQYVLRGGDRVSLPADGFYNFPENFELENIWASAFFGIQKDMGPIDPVLGIRWAMFSDGIENGYPLEAKNRILGGEFGLQVDWYESDRIRISSSTNVGTGFNNLSTTNFGYGDYGALPNLPFEDIFGYWEAKDSLDTYSNWIDASVSLNYRLTRRAALSFQYGMYWIDNLALAGSQPAYSHLSPSILGTLIPGYINTAVLSTVFVSPSSDSRVNTDGSPLMHGGSVALTFTF